jgi:hypothetical protein
MFPNAAECILSAQPNESSLQSVLRPDKVTIRHSTFLQSPDSNRGAHLSWRQRHFLSNAELYAEVHKVALLRFYTTLFAQCAMSSLGHEIPGYFSQRLCSLDTAKMKQSPSERLSFSLETHFLFRKRCLWAIRIYASVPCVCAILPYHGRKGGGACNLHLDIEDISRTSIRHYESHDV